MVYITLYKLLLHRRYKDYLRQAEGNIDKCHETLLHGTYYEEYDSYDFAHKTPAERREYLTDVYRNKLCRRYNGARQQAVIMDKYLTAEKFRDYFHRQYMLCVSEDQREAFVSFGMREGRLVVKPVDECAGRRVRMLEGDSEARWHKHYNWLMIEGLRYIVEQVIVQHPVMARWNESSVNTVRINTMQHRGNVRVLTANMRCGRARSFVDNCARGGYCANIDPATGRIITSATGKGTEKYAVHPDSGVPFEGEVIPQWDELLQATAEMALRLPKLSYVSWDMALTAEGWVLVEANKGELIADQRNLGRGLRREFEEMIKGVY